ncbi:TAT-variant-translocated molybdopterin oxidoreductase [Mucilaginibacter myungsuensis]|uniref:TAT-variant-translocated molybdopterin oxidoreductase n=1 Tax=Mucilaginibacter myungsuensis TaxID=649104 RepID=A0A929L1C0_9SPHI|nr:TAT-variant-translocated molybdopterin oxidoreductase [Mucilaginibacter myungsuensis]MBE9664450.1 TAT-variant-translocated molybdopterin oxidoreductase [Mucilaginibacter myungsuensis]MDN3601405.1 TAT-variant-translocated molybdopterin oxidoreductase [Mucilaginibacter myungsuensis]
MDSNKKYWKGLEELNNTPEFVEKSRHEFAEPIPIEDVLSGSGLSAKTPRRDFLKALGFGVGAVTLAACTPVPVHKSIPYLIKPEEVTPGIANFYVSSFEGQPILVKTREGRPIKIEGNPNDVLTKGGISAQGQAAVLDLYNSGRLQQPMLGGDGSLSEASWDALDTYVTNQLNAIKAGGKKIRIVASTVYSPSTLGVINDFIVAYPTAKLVNYDSISYTGIIKANENSFGKAVVPSYKFDKADIIVSFGADFLGSWISGEEHTLQYVSNRNAKSLEEKRMSRHIQFESGMSLTGTNADTRIATKASDEGAALLSLYKELTGTALPGTKEVEDKRVANAIKLVAGELKAAQGKALVVCGSNDIATQILVNAINSVLGSYGTTIDLDNPNKKFAGNDQEFADLIREINAGEVDALFFLNANPAYDYYKQKEFTDALAKVKLKVSFADQLDETASLSTAVAPNHHFLESWGDAEVVEGYYSIIQPAINPVYNTRQAETSLMKWSANAVADYYTYVQNTWANTIFPKVGVSGKKAWETLLQSGFVKVAPKAPGVYTFAKDLASVAQTIVSQSAKIKAGADQVELVLYQNNGIGDGKRANNPWLQEMPDPVSKVTWANYAAVAEKFGKETLKVEEGDVVEITANGYTIAVPVLFQPGQAQGTVSLALGYGRTKSGKVGDGVGANAYPFYNYANGTFQAVSVASVKANGEKDPLAQTQTHHSYEGRSVIREATFVEYKKNAGAGVSEGEHKKDYNAESLWDEHERPVYNWVMAIDLNACTGCGACVVACTAENNIPVVGKAEVRRRREMHWIRIDRYYSFNDKDATANAEHGHEGGNGALTKEKEINKAFEEGHDMDNVSVVHQPMLCQHCDHAPCETVCPVLATIHSSEGLNHMAYNRCVGTRYCANNCPFKVRRFNWFNYWNDSRFENYLQNDYTQLVLNPDVTTRFRGVMEKCSMCIQRIQSGKLKAKMEKRPLRDGEIKMACEQTCTANAIVFGNKNDPNSAVSKALASERTYYVLEELNIQPGIGYQSKIRNINEKELSA